MRARMAAEAAAAAAERRAEVERTAAEQIEATERRLQWELTIANSEGLQTRLLEIAQRRAEEVAGLEQWREGYGEQYAALLAMVNEKYDAMSTKATEAHTDIALAAEAAGFRTRADFQASAEASMNLYNNMKESGLFTIETLRAAFEAAEEAKRAAQDDTVQHALSSSEALVQGTIQIFGVLGRKYKAAAIAGAIIATYQAVAKALASAPWPANLVLAAGALAAGLANVQQIRNSEAGWATGTPGTRFEDFGRGSMEMLHGREAVVTVAQGESLAGMVGAAIRRASSGAGGGELLAGLRAEFRLDRRRQTRQLTQAFRDALLQAGVQVS